MSFLFGGRSNKTFKPRKNVPPENTHQFELMKHAQATLGSGNLRLAVRLPEGEDLNEWIAVNIVDFFNQINMLYGTITEFCTEEYCAVMSAGPKYEYHWADGHNIKKPIKCSAPKYIDYLMTWAQDQLEDESIFPSKIGVPFPKNFMQIAKTILKRLFRVYAHIYHQHFHQVVELGEEAHLNTSFKHFIFFTQEFSLIENRELVPLQELIDKLTSKDPHNHPAPHQYLAQSSNSNANSLANNNNLNSNQGNNALTSTNIPMNPNPVPGGSVPVVPHSVPNMNTAHQMGGNIAPSNLSANINVNTGQMMSNANGNSLEGNSMMGAVGGNGILVGAPNSNVPIVGIPVATTGGPPGPGGNSGGGVMGGPPR